jgi:hypothetical protein
MIDAERKAIEAVQDEYERETGERPSFDVASVYYDRRQEAAMYLEDPKELAAELAADLTASPPRDPLDDACENCVPGGMGRMCYQCSCETGELADWERMNGHN